MLQAIHQLNDYNNTLFITITSAVSVEYLYDIISRNQEM